MHFSKSALSKIFDPIFTKKFRVGDPGSWGPGELESVELESWGGYFGAAYKMYSDSQSKMMIWKKDLDKGMLKRRYLRL